MPSVVPQFMQYVLSASTYFPQFGQRFFSIEYQSARASVPGSGFPLPLVGNFCRAQYLTQNFRGGLMRQLCLLPEGKSVCNGRAEQRGDVIRNYVIPTVQKSIRLRQMHQCHRRTRGCAQRQRRMAAGCRHQGDDIGVQRVRLSGHPSSCSGYPAEYWQKAHCGRQPTGCPSCVPG